MHGASPEGLLLPGEPGPFELIGASGARRLVLVCDHAGRRFPHALAQLGLPPEATWRHISWDLGAGELTRAIAARLEATAILATYSRLVMDCNRAVENPTAFSVAGDGHRIPGNETLTPQARAARIQAIHIPYHEQLSSLIDERVVDGPTALVSVHSFTPVLNGRARPWIAGVLWDQDARMAAPLLAALRSQGRGLIGDNEPYSGRSPADYTLHRHGAARGLPHVSVEVRQDGLLTPAGVQQWAGTLASALRPILVRLGVTP